MKVYGHPLSSCTRKVLLTLAESNQVAELVPIDLFAGEHTKSSHLARHPFGVIPVLEDNDFVLFESRAIIRYLANRGDGRALLPRDPRSLARMDQWLSVDQSYIAPHTRTLAVERILRRHAGVAPDAEAVQRAEGGLAKAFTVLDEALAKSAFLAGTTFSLADISLMPYIASLAMLEAEHLLEGRSALSSWWSRVSDRPSWQYATQAQATPLATAACAAG